ncbi:MAG: hypothetical protein R3B67_13670 [Phycisphaerales bacterium]
MPATSSLSGVLPVAQPPRGWRAVQLDDIGRSGTLVEAVDILSDEGGSDRSCLRLELL